MKKILSHSSFQIISNEIIFRLVGFVTSVYVARIISVEGVGMIGIASSILIYGGLLSSPGFHIFGVRYLSQNLNLEKEIFRKVTSLRILFSVAVSILILIVVNIFISNPTLKLICIISAVTVIPFIFQFEWYFQAKENFSVINISKLLYILLQFILSIIFVKSFADLYFVPIILFASHSILFLYQFINLKKEIFFGEIKSAKLNLKLILAESFPIGFSGALVQIILNLPILFLGYFSTFEETGFYTTAFRIILTLLVVDRFFFLVIFPRVAKESLNNKFVLQAKLQSVFNLLFAYVLIISILILFFGGTIINFIWGSNFAFTILPLSFLLLYFGATLYNSILSGILISNGRQKFYAKTIYIYSFVTIFLIFTLTFYFGAVGSAFAISLGEILTTFLFWKEIKKIMKLKLFSKINLRQDLKTLLAYF